MSLADEDIARSFATKVKITDSKRDMAIWKCLHCRRSYMTGTEMTEHAEWMLVLLVSPMCTLLIALLDTTRGILRSTETAQWTIVFTHTTQSSSSMANETRTR
jgi:hypothetical protein